MTTVSSTTTKSKYILIIILSIIICLIIIICIFLLTMINFREEKSSSNHQSLKLLTSSSTVSTTTLSPEEISRLNSFKKFLNLPINHLNPNPSKLMNQFMRSIYKQIYDQTDLRRKKRQENSYCLSEQTDFIISLPNKNQFLLNTYYFEYNSSIKYLTYAEFILPLNENSTNIQIISSTFNITINSSYHIDKTWLKINLTKYIKSFPFKFSISKQKSLSGFLILYFQKSSLHSKLRRDLSSSSSFYDNQLITYPNDPSYCQVRPLRISFSELNWSSWIIEPRSYDMNICSGTCHTQSNMGTYFLIQNLLNQKYPKKISAPCCKPKRFSSTMILYYDGPNLVLKKHENMRVVECGCSS